MEPDLPSQQHESVKNWIVNTDDTGANKESSEVSLKNNELQRKLLEVKQERDDLVRKIDNYLSTWIILCGSNYTLHFMRFAIVVLYCDQQFNQPSAYLLGMMITGHYSLMALSNLHMTLSIDKNPIENVVFWHFPLLVLFLTMEAISWNFTMFFVSYVFASLSIVLMNVPWAAAMKMTTQNSSMRIGMTLDLCTQFAMLGGLSSSAFIAQFVGYRTVFIFSAFWAFFSCLLVVYHLNGEGLSLRIQKEALVRKIHSLMDHVEISKSYQICNAIDHATTVLTKTNDSNMEEGGMNDEDRDGHIDEQKQPSNIRLINLLDNDDEFITENEMKTEGFLRYICSLKGLPNLLLSIYVALRCARALEFIAWWSLRNHQLFGTKIAVSNSQCLVCLISAIISTMILMAVLPITSIKQEWSVMKQDVLLLIVTALSAGICIIVLGPLIQTFDESSDVGWAALPICGVAESITIPIVSIIVVRDMPQEFSGALAALGALLQAVVPGLQHVIIGALWDIGTKHVWLLNWMSILHGLSVMVILCFLLVRYYILGVHKPLEQGGEYSRIL